jgi:O-antigen ligase
MARALQLRIRPDILLVVVAMPVLLAVGAESGRVVDRYGMFKVTWLLIVAAVGAVGATSIPRAVAVVLFASSIVFRTTVLLGIEIHTTHILLIFLAFQVLIAWAYRQVAVPRGFSGPLVLILAGATIASVGGPDTTGSFVRGAGGLLPPLVAGIAAATLIRAKDVSHMVLATAGACLVEGGIALLQVTGHAFGPLAPFESGRVNGLFFHPNILGGYLAAASLLLLGVAVHIWSRSRLAATALVVPIGFGVAGIGATLSRGALLALVAGIAVLIVLTLRGRELWVLLALLVAAAAIAIPRIPQSEQTNFQQRFQKLLQPGTETGRRLIYKEAIQTIEQYPVTGVGPLTFGANARKYGTLPGVEPGLTHAHNVFLEGYLSLGPLGLAGFLWLLVMSVRRYLSVFRRARVDPVLKGFAAGALAALTSFLVQGMVDFLFWQLEALVLLLILLGSAFALDAIAKDRQEAA